MPDDFWSSLTFPEATLPVPDWLKEAAESARPLVAEAYERCRSRDRWICSDVADATSRAFRECGVYATSRDDRGHCFVLIDNRYVVDFWDIERDGLQNPPRTVVASVARIWDRHDPALLGTDYDMHPDDIEEATD